MTGPAGRSDAFTSGSLPESYERLLVPSLFGPWAELLLDAVAPAPGAAVLDVAAGTGALTRAAARRVGPHGRVVATDISPAMVEFNAAHPPQPGAAPVEAVVASATALGRTDGEFDVVLCQQGMPFFPDRPGALREMRRVLRPGGTIGVAVWTPGHETMPFGPINDAVRDQGAPEPFPAAWDESAFVLSPEALGSLLEDAGFHDVDSRETELMTLWPSPEALANAVDGTPFGAVLAGLGTEARRAAGEQIRRRFTEFARGGHVEVPTYSAIARATA